MFEITTSCRIWAVSQLSSPSAVQGGGRDKDRYRLRSHSRLVAKDWFSEEVCWSESWKQEAESRHSTACTGKGPWCSMSLLLDAAHECKTPLVPGERL